MSQTSFYEVTTVDFKNPREPAFEMTPRSGQPDFGKIKVMFGKGDRTGDAEIVINEGTQNQQSASDLICKWVG